MIELRELYDDLDEIKNDGNPQEPCAIKVIMNNDTYILDVRRLNETCLIYGVEINDVLEAPNKNKNVIESALKTITYPAI